MSTGIEDSRLRNAAPLEDRLEFQHPQAAITANTTRQNLAGGSGVFANFFEELAGPQNSGITACDPASSIVPDGNLTYNPDGFPHEYFHVGDSLCPSIPNAFYVPYEEDNDITILDQYKRFTDRSRGASSLHPYLYGVKDAIDLVTLRRHAVKIISKFGVRKIPGGWCQALLEASVMLRLPPHRHIVSLAAVLRLEDPDRLCLVMEHCLGSVHDLQSAGVPSTSMNYGVDERVDELISDYRDDPSANPETSVRHPERRNTDASHNTARRFAGKHGKFRVQLPTIATDIKQEAKKITDAIKNRKISNIEAGLRRKRSCTQQAQQQQFRRLSEAQAHAYFMQLIDGLHFLHRCGVIHRDIKPANLLLTPAPGCGLSPLYSVADFMDTTDTAEMDGSRGFLGRSLSEILMASRGWLMKLTDFGVSASLSTFIATDEVSGGQTTPAVQPPEVAKGVQSVFAGSKLDVYSAGVSLYFMLTGRVPFSCINVLQIFEAIAQGDYTIPGHVSASAAHLVRKMMCKDPKKRFTLEQIAKHPWVLNDPPSPISLEQIRSKMQGHSPAEFTSTWSERGFVCWLDPLEFLRRPGFDYPAPHIDETGARIFTPVELGLLDAPCEPSSPSPSEDVSVNSGEPSGIAPFSVLERLKVYHALYDPEGSARPDAINPGFTSNHNSQGHFIESKLSNLGISPIPHYAIQPMAFKKQRYYSEGLENIHHFEVGSSSLPAVYRQRGVTISLPTGSVSDRRYTMRNPMPSEPPLCPADLPVSPPLTHFPDSHTTMNVGAGGTMRADGLFSYGKPASTHVPWSKSEASESKAARHPQFRLGSDVLTLADFHPSQLVVARDSQFEDSETKLATQLSPGSNVPPDCVPSTPVKERPRTRLRRRVTLWFASLHRRLRNRSQRDSYLNESGLDRSRTCDSPFYHPVDPPSSMQNSVTSEPPSTDKHRSKSRRWLTIRSLSRHGKS
ncbi:unnamed protein product [Dicrocoelium dendriticum]|nr:unnamed protein product [Dicrocoelium dendriticum]